MLLVFVIVTLVHYSTAFPELNALRFGQTTGDYIEWTQDLSPASRQATVCTWLRKRLTKSNPVVLAYTPTRSESSRRGMILGDNGHYNQFVGTSFDLRDRYNVPNRQWFHVCWVWSTLDYKTKVYLNGRKIGSQKTRQQELAAEGLIRLGNAANYPGHVFGSDMFKLNIFNIVLSESEISSIASDICSFEGEMLTANRTVRWEDIVLKERTGSVTDIPTGSDCSEEIQRYHAHQLRLVVERNRETEGVLSEILKRLHNTEQQLAASQLRLNNTRQDLADTKNNFTRVLAATEIRLQNTEQKLETTQLKLKATEKDLVDTKGDLAGFKKKLAKVKQSTQKIERAISKHVSESDHD